jgi:hypothetical protein
VGHYHIARWLAEKKGGTGLTWIRECYYARNNTDLLQLAGLMHTRTMQRFVGGLLNKGRLPAVVLILEKYPSAMPGYNLLLETLYDLAQTSHLREIKWVMGYIMPQDISYGDLIRWASMNNFNSVFRYIFSLPQVQSHMTYERMCLLKKNIVENGRVRCARWIMKRIPSMVFDLCDFDRAIRYYQFDMAKWLFLQCPKNLNYESIMGFWEQIDSRRWKNLQAVLPKS